MTRSEINATSAALTEAQQDMRQVHTEPDALMWMDKHYYPNIETDALHDELQAMHLAIVERLAGRA